MAEGEKARYLSGLNQPQKGFTINEGMSLYMIKVCECNILKGGDPVNPILCSNAFSFNDAVYSQWVQKCYEDC